MNRTVLTAAIGCPIPDMFPANAGALVDAADHYPVGSEATYRCKEGEIYASRAKEHRPVCLKSNTWETWNDTCIREFNDSIINSAGNHCKYSWPIINICPSGQDER